MLLCSIMPALCFILFIPYYAKSYAGMIDVSLHATTRMQYDTCKRMQYHTCNKTHAISRMQTHTCNITHATKHMQYYTCKLTHATCNNTHAIITHATKHMQCHACKLTHAISCMGHSIPYQQKISILLDSHEIWHRHGLY